jgi:hypothetical protein
MHIYIYIYTYIYVYAFIYIYIYIYIYILPRINVPQFTGPLLDPPKKFRYGMKIFFHFKTLSQLTKVDFELLFQSYRQKTTFLGVGLSFFLKTTFSYILKSLFLNNHSDSNTIHHTGLTCILR